MRGWQLFCLCTVVLATGCDDGGVIDNSDTGVTDSGTGSADSGAGTPDSGSRADSGTPRADAGADAMLPPPCVEDMCGTCDADPSNDCTQDCAGSWGGSAVLDGCGTCDADPSNDCVQDCAGTFGGTAVPDMCGTCDTDSSNDCIEDCAGMWGGTATTDACGTCDADPSNDCDCAGTSGGSATTDMCGTCDADPSNDCVQDCAGAWGGIATLDGCGTCDSDSSNDCPNDCTGAPGGPARQDMCGTCDANPSNDCVQDCAGTWGGTATTDRCGTCDANPSNDCVQDCTGAWGGTAALDLCGRCVGGTTGRTACPTVVLTAVADSTVDEASPTTNNGSASTLHIVSEGRANTRRVFLRFDLSTLPADIVIRGVRLQAQAYSGYAWGGDGNVYTQFVADDAWTESGIHWNNQPATDGTNLGHWWLWYNHTPRDEMGLHTNSALVPVVQREYEGDRLISLRLHSPGYDTNYRSREHTTADQRPALVVGYLPSSSAALAPTADAYVDDGSSNYGTLDRLYVDTSPQRVFLRFDLSSLPAGAEVVGSTLTMTAYEGYAWGGDGNVYTHFVSNDAWTETGVNGINQPSVEATALGFWWLWYNHTPGEQIGRLSSDALRTAVQAEADGDDMISLRLHSPGYRTHYRSREYGTVAQRPTLTVRYVVP